MFITEYNLLQINKSLVHIDCWPVNQYPCFQLVIVTSMCPQVILILYVFIAAKVWVNDPSVSPRQFDLSFYDTDITAAL